MVAIFAGWCPIFAVVGPRRGSARWVTGQMWGSSFTPITTTLVPHRPPSDVQLTSDLLNFRDSLYASANCNAPGYPNRATSRRLAEQRRWARCPGPHRLPASYRGADAKAVIVSGRGSELNHTGA